MELQLMSQADNSYRQRLEEASKPLYANNYANAFGLYDSIANDYPDKYEPLLYSGICALNLGYHLKAITLLIKAAELEPNNAEIHTWLGKCFYTANNQNEAIRHYLIALQIDENNLPALTDLGLIYTIKMNDDAAARIFEKALALKPSSTEILLNYAIVNSRLGNFENAIKLASKAVRLEPKNDEAYNTLGKVNFMHGHMDKAIQNFNKAIEINPFNGEVYYSIAQAKKITENDRYLIQKMENVLKKSMESKHRRHILFALGKAYDDLKDREKAFSCFEKANMLIHSNYSPKDHTQNIKKIKKTFNKNYFSKIHRPVNDGLMPIFIVGLPRSGSTLIEQILSSHSNVHGIGESLAIKMIINEFEWECQPRLEFPDCMNHLDDEKIEIYKNRYLEQAGINNEEITHLIDKNLFNYRHLGFIATLFPDAKIIHTQRHPLDTGFSCYMTGFAYTESAWTHDLDYIGKYYRDYIDLMEHWNKVLPNPILNIRYEEMIADTETMVRNLLDFCDLEWEQSCLDFYKTSRGVNTASVWQVRQPIYKSAMQRWVQYAKYLQPLVSSLGDLLEDDYPKIESLGLKHGPKHKSMRGKLTRLFS